MYVGTNVMTRMSSAKEPCYDVTREVRDACLCLHLQRAARAVGRLFDQAFRPIGLTNGQFSLLMALNRPQPPTIGDVAAVLAMDRTSLTAALKPLERRGLVDIAIDRGDRRARRLSLTDAGRAMLTKAVPVWRRTHAAVERRLPAPDAERLRRDLRLLSAEA
jgi:DNA-binding MarR family transcriptional regulator